jgi:proteasome alpha subunit
VTALGAAGEGAPRALGAAQVEVAVLDRSRTGRTFRRFHDDDVAALLAPRGEGAGDGETDGDSAAGPDGDTDS